MSVELPHIKVVLNIREGFIQAYGLKFDNGVVLRTTDNLHFLGKTVREKTLKDFVEILDSLEATGYNVEGKELLRSN